MSIALVSLQFLRVARTFIPILKRANRLAKIIVFENLQKELWLMSDEQVRSRLGALSGKVL